MDEYADGNGAQTVQKRDKEERKTHKTKMNRETNRQKSDDNDNQYTGRRKSRNASGWSGARFIASFPPAVSVAVNGRRARTPSYKTQNKKISVSHL